MKLPVRITFHGLDPSDAVEAAVLDRAAQLERLCAGILRCRVVIDVLQKHRRQGRPFGVRIDLAIPGRELVVDRVAHEDVYVALRDAFDGMRRQLDDAVRQQRGQVRWASGRSAS